MSRTSREALIAKIKALLAKTVGNGCTEAEAIAALELASRLMAENAIGDTDLAFDGEGVAATPARADDRQGIRAKLCPSVGRFCGCRSWTGSFEEIVFCGLVSETVFAHWLLDTLGDFVGRELGNYLARTPGIGRVRRRESEAFVTGCCGRLCERLDALAPKRSELALARRSLIETFMSEQGINLGRGREKFRLLDAAAVDAGAAAADLAQFSRPVNGGGPIRTIDNRSGRR
jgi:hypothetical protein